MSQRPCSAASRQVTTVPDRYPAELDPTHILAVTRKATGRPGLAVGVGVGDALCVCLPTRLAARQAISALSQIGYEATIAVGKRGRDVFVTGWSHTRLEARMDAMRNVIHQLTGSHGLTAIAAVEQFRHAPAQSLTTALVTVEQTQARIRAWVSARSGIPLPRDSNRRPSDARTAMALRATGLLEHTIDHHVSSHVRAAAYAIAQYDRLSRRMPSDQAAHAATRWTSITYGLRTPPAQDSTPFIPWNARRGIRDFPTVNTEWAPAPERESWNLAPGSPARPSPDQRPGGRGLHR